MYKIETARKIIVVMNSIERVEEEKEKQKLYK